MSDIVVIDGKRYDLDNLQNISASLTDILVVTLSNAEAEAEAEADFGTYYKISWSQGYINIDFVSVWETNESWAGNTDNIETKENSSNIYRIKASAFDFVDLVMDYHLYSDEYRQEWGYRVNSLEFKITEEVEKAIANFFLRPLNRYRR